MGYRDSGKTENERAGGMGGKENNWRMYGFLSAFYTLHWCTQGDSAHPKNRVWCRARPTPRAPLHCTSVSLHSAHYFAFTRSNGVFARAMLNRRTRSINGGPMVSWVVGLGLKKIGRSGERRRSGKQIREGGVRGKLDATYGWPLGAGRRGFRSLSLLLDL